MKLRTLLELGRISNLPTVWSNCLAGMVLASGTVPLSVLPPALLALSFMYTGGMFLNDAFDRNFDREHQPERPIPAGRVRASTVFAVGFGQLVLALAIVASTSLAVGGGLISPAVVAALVLAGFIVLYDLFHKQNPFSPLLMGMCRVGVYATSGFLALPQATGLSGGAPITISHLMEERSWGWPGLSALGVGAIVLLAYLMVLTWIAKREGRGKRAPVPVHVLIAGISLVDGLLLVVFGAWAAAVGSVLAFALTLRLQRWVRGT